MSIEPILRELRRLERAGVVELDPRSLIDVVRVVELVPPGDTEALAHGLASRLTHEPERWRQVADAVRTALRGAGPAASQRAPVAPEPAPGMSLIAARVPAEPVRPPPPPDAPVAPEAPAGSDMSGGTSAPVRASRGRWLALGGALALLGVVGFLATRPSGVGCGGDLGRTTTGATTGESGTDGVDPTAATETSLTPSSSRGDSATSEALPTPPPGSSTTSEASATESSTTSEASATGSSTTSEASTTGSSTTSEATTQPEHLPLPELTELAPPQVHAQRTTEVLPPELPGPAWLPAVAVLLGLFLLGAAVVAWTAPGELSRLARARRRRMAEGPDARGVLYHVERAPPFAKGAIEDAATVLGRLVRRGIGHELDVPAMVTRTLDAGGRISPVYAPSRQREHLLVFVDREHDDHPYLEGVEWVLARWRQLGIRVLRYDYHHLPLHFEPEHGRGSLSVDELGRQTEGLPLLIFSRMRQVEATRGRVPWLRQLGHWPVRAWLDLDVRPPAERPRRERAALRALAASNLPRYPFTAEGLVAASRGLAEGFPRHRLVREPPLAPMAAQEVQLMLWAATAACVPDATWVQLEAVRRHFRGFVDASPRARPLEARSLERLLEWVAAEGYGAGVVGEGTRLHFTTDGRRALLGLLRAFDRQRWPSEAEQEQRYERRARRLLIEQLEAAHLSDDFESELRALKVAVHRAVLEPEDAATVLGEFADRAVAYELRELVDDVRAAQDDVKGGVWSEGQVEALGAVRGGRWARLCDLGRLPREWRQALALAGLVILGAGSSALGRALLPERTIEHASEVETLATWRVVEVAAPEVSQEAQQPLQPAVTPEVAANNSNPRRPNKPSPPFLASRVFVQEGQTCPGGSRFVTHTEAQDAARDLCKLLGLWSIARLADGRSMDGPGYGCKVKSNVDDRKLGDALCIKSGARETPPVVAGARPGEVCIPGTGPEGFVSGEDKTKHVVKDVCMDITEVTVDAYGKCVASGKCMKPDTGEYCNEGQEGRGSHPVNCVDLADAKAYCAAQGKRLPTEWEWEWVARGRDEGRTYPWGNEAPSCTRAVMSGSGGGGCGKDRTWPVGSKPTGNSRDGFKDMAGNVWEWTSSEYGAYYWVVRGGSWNSGTPGAFRAAGHTFYDPADRVNYLGFRCARTALE